jgi:hypothetical protein
VQRTRKHASLLFVVTMGKRKSVPTPIIHGKAGKSGPPVNTTFVDKKKKKKPKLQKTTNTENQANNEEQVIHLALCFVASYLRHISIILLWEVNQMLVEWK